MKALIYTGHPAWKESLNPIIKSRWEQHINEIPEIESFRLYSVYHQSQKDIESQLKDEEILIGFNIDNYLDESFFERHPNLKYISTLAMGYGNFDRDAAKKHNVTLTNTVMVHRQLPSLQWHCFSIYAMIYVAIVTLSKKLLIMYFQAVLFLILLTSRLNYTAKHLALSDWDT